MKATKHAPFPRRGVINKSVSVLGVSTGRVHDLVLASLSRSNDSNSFQIGPQIHMAFLCVQYTFLSVPMYIWRHGVLKTSGAALPLAFALAIAAGRRPRCSSRDTNGLGNTDESVTYHYPVWR